MKWIVFWIVVQSFMVACPQPEVDEYGRGSQSITVTLQACYETELKNMQKEFDCYTEAVAFMRAGQAKANEGWENTLQNFEIKEIVNE